MNFELDQMSLELQERTAAVAASVADVAAEADQMSEVHPRLLDALRDGELGAYTVPAEYGGMSERVDPLQVTLIREQLMKVSTNLDSLFGLQGIGSFAISTAGTEEQRQTWLPRVATMEAIAGLALTEDEAGSDLKNLATTVREDDQGLLVDGQKTWISNAGAADFYVVLGREAEGFSTVLVPADTPGVTTSGLPPIVAPHVLGTVSLIGVRLPSEARIGDAGKGFRHVLATLATFRVSVAGAAVGLASAALEEAVRHTRTREQFGRPLARLGPVAGLLADSWAEVEAARLLTYRAAVMARTDPMAAIDHSSMAKLHATEMASRVTDRCVQVMGRWGLVRDSRVERAYRSARPMRIYEGASEVLRLGVAKRLEREVP